MSELTTRPADVQETETWRELWMDRLTQYAARTRRPARTAQAAARRERAEEAVLLRLIDGDEPVGYLSLLQIEQDGARMVVLEDLHIEEPYRRRGYGRAALAIAREWTRGRSPRVNMGVDPTDPAQQALFRDVPLGSQNMHKDLGERPALPDGVTVRRMSATEFGPWWTEQMAGYAESFVLNGLLTEEEARERAERQSAELLPSGLDTPGHDIYTIVAEDKPVASIWVCHEVEPDTSFVFDVVVDDGHRGKGYGRAAMLAAEQSALDAGAQVLGLNVFGHNEVALRLYTSLGYRPTSQMRTMTV
ncbi:GNAT superfamily N-acetyltransferase [Hamadaea flava]|uniref:GNAT family N-acetyltransferase n=1 Tax=Hamadaea flava TaxID=1742688 RepID=A0ABV8LQU2_9ACTN|nr:GNAT family N-acetyltransferase [Hamadaea flava]MCP2322491.1 GNAT superfamily N-acetyltransferase [Hamadaea flava]